MYETLQNNGRKYQPQLVSWISSITGWIVYLCIPWKKTENTHTHTKKTRTTFYSTSHYVTFSPLIFVKSFDDGLAVVCLNCPKSWIHKHNSFMVTCQNLYVKHPAWMAHQKHVFSNPIGFPWDERYICLHLPESTIHVGKYTTHGSYGNWFTSWSVLFVNCQVTLRWAKHCEVQMKLQGVRVVPRIQVVLRAGCELVMPSLCLPLPQTTCNIFAPENGWKWMVGRWNL